MRPRFSIPLGVLIVLLVAPLTFSAPEFDPYLTSSLNLNPGDQEVLVHEISVEQVMTPIRIKELTVKNHGTASGNEIREVRIRYREESGNWASVVLDDLTGIGTGITFSLPGDGMKLDLGDVGQFRILVSVAEPEKVPVSKYGEEVSLQLSGMLHYVYLGEDGEAMESVSSNWIEDPGVDRIARAGFEGVHPRSLSQEIIQPGTTVNIGQFVFRDHDPNKAGVEVDLITLKNRSGADDPVVLGQDITEVKLGVRLVEDGQVTERTISKAITSPTTQVSVPTEPGGWWDGRCQDDCQLTINVEGKISSRGPVQGMKLRTGLSLDTKENNGMSGYPFRQGVTVPEPSVQSVVVQGLEGIEETTEWRSGVVNRGETYKQRLVLQDQDRDSDDFVVRSIGLRNEGSLPNSDIKQVSVYRSQPEGGLVTLGSDLTLSSDWQILGGGTAREIPDDGRGVFEIHYTVAEDATEKTTFQPVVQFRGTEGTVDKAPSPVHTSPDTLKIYPYGAEVVEASRGSMRASPISGREGVIGQRIDVMDRDENRFNLLINPIVIKNTGTATGSDFRKLELFDSDGNLLVTRTDLNGLTTGGVTLNNLDGKTTVTDSQVGNWRTFYVYLTPRSGIGNETLNLKTTLYQTEGDTDIVSTLNGPQLNLGGTGSGNLISEQPIREVGEAVSGLGDQPFGVGFAAGTSYPNFPSLGAKLFLDVPLEEIGLEFDQGGEGSLFGRFGFELDSSSQSSYYYPNLSLGYKFPSATGVNQFFGAGAGGVFLSETGLSDTFGFHGIYGVTTTELFEEEIPVLLQAKLKYIGEPISETVLGVNLGVLFS